MEEKKLKAMFFNGSPRKNKNTADMLQSAMRGAEAAGAETELVHLYDIDFKGCKSCFACKLKNSKCNGVCALKDDLRPVLERARQADVLVLGSPVYYSYPTGVIRAFMERLCFPVGTYMYEREEGESDGHLGRDIDKVKELGLTLVEGSKVSVPAIAEMPLTLECKVIYRQEEDNRLLPETIRSRFYPPLSEVRNHDTDKDNHIIYFGEIVDAYIVEDK